MRNFVTDKNRVEIKKSLETLRADILNCINTKHDNCNLQNLEEVKRRLDHIVLYMKTAQLYKQLEDDKGSPDF